LTTARTRVKQASLCSLDHLPDAGDLVCRQVVHDDGVAGVQFRNENFLDIGAEGIAIHWAGQKHRGCNTIEP